MSEDIEAERKVLIEAARERDDKELVEKMWERCPQFLGDGFGEAVCIPADEWRAMKRYIRRLRTQVGEPQD